MKKTCVFCGAPPEGKSVEHIIPEWLLALTGGRNRLGVFGARSDPDRPRLFPWAKFHFPACDQCNKAAGKHEGRISPIVAALLEGRPVTGLEFDELLDWFDKVRVGFWLARRYLDGNAFGVEPNFHIRDRMGRDDRCLAIYRTNDASEPLLFTGTSGPSFQFSPTAIGLRIRDLVFVNISTVGLCARGMGFPVVEDRRWTDITQSLMMATVRRGCSSLTPPLLECPPLPPQGTTLCQSIHRRALESETRVYYQEEYAVAQSHGMPYGRSRIAAMFPDGNCRFLLPDTAAAIALHPSGHTIPVLADVSRFVFATQLYFLEHSASKDALPLEQRQQMDACLAAAERYVADLRAACEYAAREGWTLLF